LPDIKVKRSIKTYNPEKPDQKRVKKKPLPLPFSDFLSPTIIPFNFYSLNWRID
jgi:hypothetical protein